MAADGIKKVASKIVAKEFAWKSRFKDFRQEFGVSLSEKKRNVEHQSSSPKWVSPRTGGESLDFGVRQSKCASVRRDGTFLSPFHKNRKSTL